MAVPWEDEELLRELYVDQEMTQQEVADAIGCSRSTIQRHMKEKGIERRPATDRQRTAEERYRHTDHSKEKLKRMYYEEGMSSNDIAAELGVTPRGVRYWMEELGLDRRSNFEYYNDSGSENND